MDYSISLTQVNKQSKVVFSSKAQNVVGLTKVEQVAEICADYVKDVISLETKLAALGVKGRSGVRLKKSVPLLLTVSHASGETVVSVDINGAFLYEATLAQVRKALTLLCVHTAEWSDTFAG